MRNEHNWQANAEGKTILKERSFSGRPDLQARILDRRNAFEKLLGQYSDDNNQVSSFMRAQTQRIRRKYKTKHIGYVWVREMEKAKTQHYHCAFFIDGDVLRTSNVLNQQIKVKWYKHGHRSVVPKPFYFIDKHNFEDKRKKVIHRLSYLAKVRGKGYRSSQAKDYSTSRLRPNW